jgi:hypothetical protein
MEKLTESKCGDCGCDGNSSGIIYLSGICRKIKPIGKDEHVGGCCKNCVGGCCKNS